MLLENFIISKNVIFARLAIFSTLYVGKSSGKQDHYDLRGYQPCIFILDISWKLVRPDFIDTTLRII